MRPSDELRNAVDLVRTAKESIPDDWLLFLIWEYGLDELLPYLPDPRTALENGLQWQPIRGTPAGLHMAFAWLGVTAVIQEEDPTSVHWYEYQLSPYTQLSGQMLQESGDGMLLESGGALMLDYPRICIIPPLHLIRMVVALANLSAPVGTRLSRIFCAERPDETDGCDIRRFILDQSDWGDILSDDGGVFVPELGIKVSMCRETDSIATYAGASVINQRETQDGG